MAAFLDAHAIPDGTLLTPDLAIIGGGPAGSGDQCEALSHHGFWGQDAEVVTTVTNWLKALR